MRKFIELHRNGNVGLVNVDSIISVDKMLNGADILMPVAYEPLTWVHCDESYEDIKKMLGEGE